MKVDKVLEDIWINEIPLMDKFLRFAGFELEGKSIC